MTRLPYLHEPGVLWNLRSRYVFDDIYTYTGTILIAVNPFANLQHLYGAHMMDQYKGADLGELSPHVYAIADSAYRQMRKENKGQSILVCTGMHACCEMLVPYNPNPCVWQELCMHAALRSCITTLIHAIRRSDACCVLLVHYNPIHAMFGKSDVCT